MPAEIKSIIIAIVLGLIALIVILKILNILGITIMIHGVSGSPTSPLCAACRTPCAVMGSAIQKTLTGSIGKRFVYIIVAPLLRCGYCGPFCGY